MALFLSGGDLSPVGSCPRTSSCLSESPVCGSDCIYLARLCSYHVAQLVHVSLPGGLADRQPLVQLGRVNDRSAAPDQVLDHVVHGQDFFPVVGQESGEAGHDVEMVAASL